MLQLSKSYYSQINKQKIVSKKQTLKRRRNDELINW